MAGPGIEQLNTTLGTPAGEHPWPEQGWPPRWRRVLGRKPSPLPIQRKSRGGTGDAPSLTHIHLPKQSQVSWFTSLEGFFSSF